MEPNAPGVWLSSPVPSLRYSRLAPFSTATATSRSPSPSASSSAASKACSSESAGTWVAVTSVKSVVAGGGGVAQAVIEAQDRAVNSRNDGVDRLMLFVLQFIQAGQVAA